MNEKVINHDSLTSFEGNKINNLYGGGGGGGNSGGGGGSTNYINGGNANENISWLWKQPIFQELKEVADEIKNNSWSEIFTKCRGSRKLVLLVVFIALFFDNMLLTTVGKCIT